MEARLLALMQSRLRAIAERVGSFFAARGHARGGLGV
jgi:hypothetical protein